MPEGTPLERTDAVVRDIEAFLRTVPEVTDYSSYVGTASPIDFNGMVRHYYMRQGSNIADVRVNLLDKDFREQQSHALGMRLREELLGLQRWGARIKLVEMPPGPPVLSSIVAEVYGTPRHAYADLVAAAGEIESRLEQQSGVVDIDSVVEEPQALWTFEVDREKAGLSGISVADVAATLRMALSGERSGAVHLPHERNELAIELRLPEPSRSSIGDLERIVIKGRDGAVVQLGELGRFHETFAEQTIYRKNLERVVYVTAEAAGVGPAYPVIEMIGDLEGDPLPAGIRTDWAGEGEWKITLDVFRDLGIAFLAALVGIFVLLTYETRSYVLPLIIMISIPLTMIGIMPGFWILNLLAGGEVGGYADQIFFTATAMIGMIALSGIVVRNAIILIDFIRKCARRRPADAGGDRRVGRRPRPPHLPDRRHHPARRLADHPRSDLQRPGVVADLRSRRLHGLYPGHHPDRFLSDLRGTEGGRDRQRRSGLISVAHHMSAAPRGDGPERPVSFLRPGLNL
jgi:multidrug efflux pump subunit AcrB